MKYIKQEHGKINYVFKQEEESLIAQVEKAKNSSSNSQILGRTAEEALVNFLNNYLPTSLRAVRGHFVTPKGNLSPEIDVLVIDSRFPLLSQNTDGSVVVMLHSLLSTIETKSNLDKGEVENMLRNSKLISSLVKEVFPLKTEVFQYAFAYHSQVKLDTLEKHFFKDYKKERSIIDLHLLRVPKASLPNNEPELGASIWLEAGRYPAIMLTRAPLSDLYYSLVQNSYYGLDSRRYDFQDLGRFMMDYMSWGTYLNFEKEIVD